MIKENQMSEEVLYRIVRWIIEIYYIMKYGI